jgi:hypothetical protein
MGRGSQSPDNQRFRPCGHESVRKVAIDDDSSREAGAMLTFLLLLCVALFLGALLGAAWDLSITELLPWTDRRVPVRVRARGSFGRPDRFTSPDRGSLSDMGDWASWNDPLGIDPLPSRSFD